MKTLKQLVEEYGATGFVLASTGNESSDSIWVSWNEKSEKEYGEVFLHKIESKLDYLRYRNLMDKAVDYDSDPIFVSKVISPNANPYYEDSYRYIIIF